MNGQGYGAVGGAEPPGDAGAITIVRAGPERIADLEPLWRSLHEHHMAVATRPPHLVQRSADDAWARRKQGYVRWLAEPDAFVLLAERRGRPVGYAVVHVVDGWQSWETGDRIGELQTLTLLPEERGEGIGTLLMEAIEHELLRLGIGDLVVAVAAGNDGAQRFYERRGFTTRLNVLLSPISRGSG